MSNSPLQIYTLFQMLKSAGANGIVSRADIAKELGVNEGSVPVYFFWLKKFGVKFDVIKNGRAVQGYRLLNGDEVDVPMNRRKRGSHTKAASVKAVKAVKPMAKVKAKPVMAKVTKTANKPVKDDVVNVSDMEIEELTDIELTDIKSQLGLA